MPACEKWRMRKPRTRGGIHERRMLVRRRRVRVARAAQRADVAPHLLARRRAGGGVFQPARSRRPARIPRHAAQEHAAVLAGAGQQPAGARRRHPRRGHRHASGLTRLERINDTTPDLRSRRALRAPRAPVHQVGHGTRGILRGHPGHAGWRAGHERRRLRRRDLAACAQRRRLRRARQRAAARRARISYGYRHIVPPAPGEFFLARRAAVRVPARASPKRRCASCCCVARKRSPSASGAAARRSPIRAAITPRGSSRPRASRARASATSWCRPSTPTSSSMSRRPPPPTSSDWWR